METAAIIKLVQTGLELVEKLLPVINDLARKGQVTPAQQADLRAKYESLRTKADGQFSGPHWEVTS